MAEAVAKVDEQGPIAVSFERIFDGLTPSKADAQGMLEVNVTNSPDFKNGQPAVAINPTNPNNLVLSATHHTCSVAPAANPPSLPCPAHSSFLAYSMDRGATWTPVPWPGDPDSGEVNVVVDPAGTFYVIYNALGAGGIPVTDWPVDIARSTDGG